MDKYTIEYIIGAVLVLVGIIYIDVEISTASKPQLSSAKIFFILGDILEDYAINKYNLDTSTPKDQITKSEEWLYHFIQLMTGGLIGGIASDNKKGKQLGAGTSIVGLLLAIGDINFYIH
jgi:hypothetical protein